MSHLATSQMNASGFGILFTILVVVSCYHSRKKPIGGWLLFFFYQIWIGGAAALFTTITKMDQFLPSAWSGDSHYAVFLFGTLPHIFMLFIQTIVATVLYFRKEVKWLKLLRGLLCVTFVAVVLHNVIDGTVFHQNGAATAFFSLPAVLLAIWIAYLFLSKRVKAVFETKTFVALTEPPVILPKSQMGLVLISEASKAEVRGEIDKAIGLYRQIENECAGLDIACDARISREVLEERSGNLLALTQVL